MFRLRRGGTIIAEGLKIIGNVTAEGLVEVNGQVEGDVQCTSLMVSPKALIEGGVQADRVVVNGKVEGPIRGREVLLKPQSGHSGGGGVAIPRAACEPTLVRYHLLLWRVHLDPRHHVNNASDELVPKRL
jgi:hypothetical protein